MDTYLTPYPGHYFTGDGALRDKDGYYWILGRVDDVINVVRSCSRSFLVGLTPVARVGQRAPPIYCGD